MKCLEVEQDRVSQGILVVVEPSPHIALAKTLSNPGEPIAIAPEAAKNIITIPVVRRRYNYRRGKVGLVPAGEEHRLFGAGVTAAPKSETNRFGIVVSAAESGDGDAALVRLRFCSGYGGRVVYARAPKVRIIAESARSASDKPNDLGISEILAIMGRGEEIRATMTGEAVIKRYARLLYEKGQLTSELGDEPF